LYLGLVEKDFVWDSAAKDWRLDKYRKFDLLKTHRF
jgi:hypothetical protein